MNVDISRRLLVFICGSCLLAYLTILLYKPRSATTADVPPLLQVEESINVPGPISRIYPDPSNPAMVLVLTYMRSGSSMTGDMLQQSPGAFYVYEPFRSMDNKNTSIYTLMYANGSRRKPPFTFQEETYDALYNWFTCNISKISVIGLLDPFMSRATKTSNFPACYKMKKRMAKKQTSAIQACARELQSICSDSPFRIIKTIRIQLHDITDLLKDLPNLKIIHLVRDPRATLSSRAELGRCALPEEYISCANVFCKRLENDIVEKDRLLERYPNRIMTVFYEDIARQPLEASKKMYDFIGANFTLKAQKYIYNITMAGKKDNCEICTIRSNSSKHVDAWKRTMNIDYIKIINERCNYVLKRYNFDEFPILKEFQYMPII